MSYFVIGYRLPKSISVPLFGDREKFGLIANADDSCWIEWQNKYLDFYYSNQKGSIGEIVNNAGYKVMSKLDLTDKKILEIGTGDINHIGEWKGIPNNYIIADTNQAMLDSSAKKLKEMNLSFSQILLDNNDKSLPFDNEEFDVIISFYSLEHLFPLITNLEEIVRILKYGGRLIGAIPTDGGLLWGAGRYFTSRRWLKRNTNIDLNKIICWEHPDFADFILKSLDSYLTKHYINYWPFRIPLIDLNLVIKFVYEKG